MSRACVLIVDSFDGGEMYAEHLRHHGLQVQLYKRPEEALENVGPVPPDVVVTDVVFTHSSFDGPTFIRRLRQRPATAAVPVIVLSGYVRESDRQIARRAGADRFLMKPCLPQALLVEIKAAVVAKHRGARLKWNWATSAPDRRKQDRGRGERRQSSR